MPFAAVSIFILFFVILLCFDAILGVIFRIFELLGQFWTIFTLFWLWYRLTCCGLVILAVVSNYLWFGAPIFAVSGFWGEFLDHFCRLGGVFSGSLAVVW